MTIETRRSFEPDIWRTKLYCTNCLGHFPLRFVEDHIDCCVDTEGNPTPNSIYLCDLFAENELFSRLDGPSDTITQHVPLLVHGQTGSFYSHRKFVWSDPVVWAPRWVVSLEEAGIQQKDKDLLVPIAATNREIRSALEALLYMADEANKEQVVRRFIDALVDDHEVLTISSLKVL